MRAIVILGAILFLWKLFGKQLLAFFLLRGASRAALSKLGDHAVAAQPDSIKLNRLGVPTWKESAVPQMVTSLEALGFTELGNYSVDPMPDVKVAVLFNTKDSIAAHVYEHAKAGTWLELVTRYQDGTSATLTTLASTGQTQPPWLQTMRSAKLPASDLVRQFICGRPVAAMKKTSADSELMEFEQGYAKYMLWRKGTPMKAEEVAPTVQKWATKRSEELVAK